MLTRLSWLRRLLVLTKLSWVERVDVADMPPVAEVTAYLSKYNPKKLVAVEALTGPLGQDKRCGIGNIFLTAARVCEKLVRPLCVSACGSCQSYSIDRRDRYAGAHR